MPRSASFRRAAVVPIAALALLCAPAPAFGADLPTEGDLSPRLAELAKPALGSAPLAEQARELSLPAGGPGSLLREGNRVLVDVRFDHGAAAAVEDLRATGAKVVDVSRRYQTVTVAAKPGELANLSDVPRVTGVTEVLAPSIAASTCPSGAVVSEGDEQLRAAKARETFGVDGSGVTVGILSDSFDRDGTAATHASGDVAAGDLPGSGNPCGHTQPVGVLDDSEAFGADEGRGMAQIVHDLAPGAKLAFATAFTGETAFAENVERLAKPVAKGGAGAGVIADDVFYFDEPFFQDGPVAVAVDRVNAEGIAYFSAAGNDNVLVGGKDVGSWQGDFHGTGNCPAGIPHYAAPDQYDCTDFNGAGDTGFGITVKPNGSLLIDLQWAEPWYGVGTDLDAYLVDSSNAVVAESEEDNPGGSGKPFELLSWENTKPTAQTVTLVVKRYSGSASPVFKFAMLENGSKAVTGTEYPESTGSTTVGPTIFGHSAAAAAIGVAAVPYYDSAEPEYYSSRGPVTHYFGPVDGTSPAEPLPSTETLSKPDLAATDCGVTTFFAFESGGSWRFCGTSAAAPHAAAVAALMRSASPLLTPAEVRTALTATAQPVGGFGPNAVGAGLVDAVGALGEVAEPAPEEGSEEEPEGEEPEEEPAGEGGAPPTQIGSEEVRITGPLATASLPVARRLPRTFFVTRPSKVIRIAGGKARVVFEFGAGEPGSTFECRVDGGPFHFCPARLVHRFGVGSHAVWAIARDAVGNADPSPAVCRFQVKLRRGA
jgi:hypothetical protein